MANTNKIPDSAYAKKAENSFFEVKPAVTQGQGTNIVIPEITPKFIEIMRDVLSQYSLTFERIRIPTGGSLVFEIPSESEDKPIATTELYGIILDQYPARIYFDKQNAAPACMSIDMTYGIGNPGGKCEKCPHYQWGSKENGIGRACKEIVRAYILLEYDQLPFEFNIPPTSKKNFVTYLRRLAAKDYYPYEVITKITLKKATNQNGITYSQAVFSMHCALDEATKERMKKYALDIQKLTRRINLAENEEDEETEHNETKTEKNEILDNFEEAPQNNDDDLPF